MHFVYVALYDNLHFELGVYYTLLEISFSAVQKSVDLEPVCTNATYDLTESIKQEFAKVLLCPKLGLDWSYVM